MKSATAAIDFEAALNQGIDSQGTSHPRAASVFATSHCSHPWAGFSHVGENTRGGNWNETRYSYFGARYYWPEVSVWLSVDPMADERSWLSPYNYCQWNPVARIDPNGELDIANMDEWEILHKVDGSIEVNRMSDLGGESTQIVNYSHENANGDHVQLMKPVAHNISTNDFSQQLTTAIESHNASITNTQGQSSILGSFLNYASSPLLSPLFNATEELTNTKGLGYIPNVLSMSNDLYLRYHRESISNTRFAYRTIGNIVSAVFRPSGPFFIFGEKCYDYLRDLSNEIENHFTPKSFIPRFYGQ